MSEPAGMETLALTGELDAASAPGVEQRLARIERLRPPLVVVDLRDLTFVDSTGLGLLVRADARARAEGRRLVLVPGPEPVQRIFRITLLDRRLEFLGGAAAVAQGAGPAV